MDDAAWNDAAVYQLNIPAAASGRRLILNIHYTGDAARLYVGDKLFDDNFYNGDPFSIPLWRIPVAQWPQNSTENSPLLGCPWLSAFRPKLSTSSQNPKPPARLIR